MTTVPCPKNDGGICTIPDQTALVRTSGLELVSRSAVLDRFPAAEAEEGLLTLVAGDHQQIMQALERPQEPPPPELASAFQTAFRQSPAATSVVVNCSCGDVYIKDL